MLTRRAYQAEVSSSESSKHENSIRPSTYRFLEREASNVHHSAPTAKPTVAESTAKVEDPSVDRIKSIAFNSREVRLVGPEQKEVEMKDDVATKMVVALDNLQKEATEVWGQVNEKLDKGWTDLKSMIEEAIAKAKKNGENSPQSRPSREAPAKSSLVMVSDVDSYSMADEESSLGKQVESAGAKVKDFFVNIGFNQENQKKASDALSKAGDSVSESVKDLPDTLKKAGNAVSDTVTKDIPDAIKNFFG